MATDYLGSTCGWRSPVAKPTLLGMVSFHGGLATPSAAAPYRVGHRPGKLRKLYRL